MTTVATIQARMGSRRFPGKVMADLAGKPVLRHVIERAFKIEGVDRVVVAIPDTGENTPLISLASALGAKVSVGPERNVLHRFYRAAATFHADVIVRITADCPLLDPVVCSEVVALRRSAQVSYASNVVPRCWPQGLDCEVFTRTILDEAEARATSERDIEHVTPYMQRLPASLRANLTAPFLCGAMRWTLDYPEDLDMMRALYKHGDPVDFAATRAIFIRHPEISDINAGVGPLP